MNPNRRHFLQTAAAATAGITLAQLTPAAPEPNAMDTAPVPKRPLGKTGLQTSVLGLGGYTLGDAPDLDTATRVVAEALDAGVNFFDNAWEYHDGKSEDWLGQALKGKRDQAFLMTKVCTHGRDKSVALKQLEDSLKRLRTDHLDVWQIHEVVYWNDPDLAAKPDGVLAALDQAKKDGKTRFVGFTGHKDPRIHLKMLSHDYPFDTIQMPLNCFDSTYRSFETQVLPEATKRGLAVLGMKSLCGGPPALYDFPVPPELALRYAMSIPGVSVTISGIDTPDILHQNLSVARGFTPMTPQEMSALRAQCAPYAADGHLELYKSTKKFDGNVGREQHDYPPPEKLPL